MDLSSNLDQFTDNGKKFYPSSDSIRDLNIRPSQYPAIEAHILFWDSVAIDMRLLPTNLPVGELDWNDYLTPTRRKQIEESPEYVALCKEMCGDSKW